MTTMTRVLHTHSRGGYTTILPLGTQKPCISLDCVVVHPDSPVAQSAAPSNQVARHHKVHEAAEALVNQLNELSADLQDMGYNKVALNFVLQESGLSFNTGLLKLAP
jgi:hypothetical protein